MKAAIIGLVLWILLVIYILVVVPAGVDWAVRRALGI